MRKFVLLLSPLALLMGLGCARESDEISTTFVGTITAITNTGDTQLVDIKASGSEAIEKFVVEGGLSIDTTKRYAFRVWGNQPPRHISEAIPID